MSSIKDRQRAAARARLEKEMAERSAAARKRRQRQAIIGSALVVIVIAGAAFWIVNTVGADDSDEPANNAGAAPAGTVACTWNPEDAAGGGKVVDVGTPGPNAPNTGTATMTMSTTLGDIVATVDRAKAPCTAAAIEYLASKKFWDGTKCHRMVTEGIKVLQCGDPSAKGKGYRQTDGTGGPSFRYAEENLPTAATPPYPRGTIAMAKTQAPASTGSQFFIVYGDAQLPPDYTVLGKVTKGMEIVDKVAKAGTDNANQPGDGHPKQEIGIKSLLMAAA
ncbi:peptidylprolyl isomerase [Jidongwangia harbinensis]|uniref:peptidylprolyl isomerase n=1 Tax=Jidongwangia harbinensis TaxID=2878561 RepID=UPI001CD9420E|nr:peptidylprolyl isomerase [Jidongwangia harbinensis]MCA2214707.1 peptidylprolyl isomerase [Jidongwangia harbinensis]